MTYPYLLPEGLHLGLTPEDTPAIFDAQGIMWIEFTDGGNEDPIYWQSTVIKQTCSALGVTEAFLEDGTDVSIDVFVTDYNGSVY